MKQKISFLVAIVLLFTAMDLTVMAQDSKYEDIEPPAYVTGVRTSHKSFYDETRDFIYYFGEDFIEVSEGESFYEVFLEDYLGSDLEFDSVLMDNSVSMTDTFKHKTNKILNNLPDKHSDKVETMFSNSCAGTNLTEKILEIAGAKECNSVIIISDLWDTSNTEFPGTAEFFYSLDNFEYKRFVFFVPYYSTDIEAVRHCEDYALQLVDFGWNFMGIYIVYLDEVVMRYYWDAMYGCNATYAITPAYTN